MNKDTEVLVGEDIGIKILNNLQASGFIYDVKDVMEKDVEKYEKLEECQDSTGTSENDGKTTSKDVSENQWIQLYILIAIFIILISFFCTVSYFLSQTSGYKTFPNNWSQKFGASL